MLYKVTVPSLLTFRGARMSLGLGPTPGSAKMENNKISKVMLLKINLMITPQTSSGLL